MNTLRTATQFSIIASLLLCCCSCDNSRIDQAYKGCVEDSVAKFNIANQGKLDNLPATAKDGIRKMTEASCGIIKKVCENENSPICQSMLKKYEETN